MKNLIFKEKGNLTHNNKYDYTLVEYKSTKTKVKIICQEHGVFEQTPEKHISRKQGCPKCSKNNKLDTETFIVKANLIHKNNYNYDLVEYKNATTKVKIICKKHGVFEQKPHSHLSGNGCPKCVGKEKSNDNIISELKEIHNNLYDYSLVNYKKNYDKLLIICKEHGVFKQTYNTHKKGHGCPKCSGNLKSTTNNFIEQGKIVHNDKYDYSLVDYSNSTKDVKIICPKHGEFEQIAYHHLNGSGCPKCATEKRSKLKIKPNDVFINEVTSIHNGKYDYSLVDYENSKIKVKIICPEHGVFKQTPDSHSNGNGCPKCGAKFDKTEGDIKSFIKELNIDFIENTKKIISPLELDIYIPSHNLAIEFNGLYWHNEIHKPKNYHLNKTELCENLGIKLIHIFEDEWLYNKEIVKSRIRNILGLNDIKIFARKCTIKEVLTNESVEFLNQNHIQGNCNSKIKLGLYYNGELVSLMTFGKGRISINGKEEVYELNRFCNKLNCNVVGAASRLLKYFKNNNIYNEIVSYADRRWSQGDLYEKLGFEFIHNTKPNYHYVIGKKRKHKFSFRKGVLVKEGYDINKSESEIMLERGIFRIYDCGVKTYKIKKGV